MPNGTYGGVRGIINLYSIYTGAGPFVVWMREQNKETIRAMDLLDLRRY